MKNNDVSDRQSLAIERRDFMLGTTAALLLMPHLAFSEASAGLESSRPIFGLQQNQDLRIQPDLLFGKGKDRVATPGRGSEYLAAWLLGFTHGLNARETQSDYLRCEREELLPGPGSER